VIQVGSQVRVVRPGQFEFRGEVVDMRSARFGGRPMVKVRPDPDQVTVVAAPGALDRWVRVTECIEDEPIMPVPPDARLPRSYGCGGCTHSRIPHDREAGGGSADENEFECLLLGRAETRRRVKDGDPWRDPELVWGENPICTDADWPVYQVSAPPDAPSSRPDRDDAVALRVLSDQLEELGLDPGAALLRDVAGRIERDVGTREGLAEYVPTRDAGTLDRELRFYRSHLDDLLGTGDVNEGKHVVIKGTDIAGVCDTFEEALVLGYGKYGLGGFLVKKIERVETIHRI
jgi:hypothetical protein